MLLMCYLATVTVARAVRLGVQMRSWSRQCEWLFCDLGLCARRAWPRCGSKLATAMRAGSVAAAILRRGCQCLLAPVQVVRRAALLVRSSSRCRSHGARQLPVRRVLRDTWQLPPPLASLRVAGCTTSVAM